MTKSRKPRNPDLKYTRITETILEHLRQGTAPWVRPWNTNPLQAHQNGVTGHQYTGINTILTWAAAMNHGYASNKWYTFKQLTALGASNKGEKATWITYAKPFPPKKDENGEVERDEDGKPKRGGFMFRVYKVWNQDQLQGIEFEPDAPIPPFEERQPAIDAFIEATGADIRHGSNRAFLTPATGRIVLPHAGEFHTPSAYYSTVFHELIHWSGLPQHLDRDLKGRHEKRSYAFEELIAEIGAAFLAAEFGLPGRLQHPEYINEWIQVLENDHRAIVTAASQAQKAVTYLLNYTNTTLDQEAA